MIVPMRRDLRIDYTLIAIGLGAAAIALAFLLLG
jgi:hypothetical protein